MFNFPGLGQELGSFLAGDSKIGLPLGFLTAIV